MLLSFKFGHSWQLWQCRLADGLLPLVCGLSYSPASTKPTLAGNPAGSRCARAHPFSEGIGQKARSPPRMGHPSFLFIQSLVLRFLGYGLLERED